ncbi:hypothetical protein NW768_012139 [Fusarium equiseti]|uniref:Proteoglycan n=1 Tax=Fusarium equiseti TaxID=61235 RepID=A0ABQ8QVV7_FUSEQ|nr:hypothetical protein NW768_012139 [Fusarium equiseti]
MKLSRRLGACWVLNLSLIPNVLAAATCDELSGSIYTGPNGRNFDILCETAPVNGNIFAFLSNGDQFQDCVDECDARDNCILALYLDGTGDCALINSFQGTTPLAGNDIAIFRPAPTTTSAEVITTEATTSGATTTEAATTESSTAESSTVATSAETTSSDITSVEATTTETSSAEISTTEPLTVEPSSSETTSSIATSRETTETESSTITTSTAGPQPTESSSTESSTTQTTSVEPSSTSVDSTPVTTQDSSSTSTAATEASTEDVFPITAIDTTTGTGSTIQPATSSDQSLSASTVIPQSSEPSTSPSSTIPTIVAESSSMTTASDASMPTSLSISATSQDLSFLPASLTSTVTQIYTTNSQPTSLNRSPTTESEEVVSTTSVSGITIMETKFESQLPTYLPASDCVWTVYLTMVKYVTCSTGVVAETSTTATYVTVDGNRGSYGPPVVQLLEGCIGGYQVDASGKSYPVVQPTMGSHGKPSDESSHASARPIPGSPGGSRPSYKNGEHHIPAPTAGSQGNFLPGPGSRKSSAQHTQESQTNPSDKSQPLGLGEDSQEHNDDEHAEKQYKAAPTSITTDQSDTPLYPSLVSPVPQGQYSISTTFTMKTTAGGEAQMPSSSLPSSAEAPSTLVITSGSDRHKSTLWTSVAGAILVSSMLSV